MALGLVTLILATGFLAGRTLLDVLSERQESYIDYPANYRLLFMPTAFTPGANTLILNNREIINTDLSYGFGNRFQLTSGFALVPAYSMLANIHLKYRFLDFADYVHFAAFGSVMGAAGFGSYTNEDPPDNLDEIEAFWGKPNATEHFFGGGVITLGNEYHNLSFSAYGKFSPHTDEFYFYSVGGALSIIKNIKLIAEYNYIPEGMYSDGFGGITGRWYNEKFSIDIGAAVFGPSAAPYVQFAYTPKFN